MRIAWMLLSFVVLLGLSAIARGEDEMEDVAVPVRDEAVLRKLIDAAAPDGVSEAGLEDFYRNKYGAAQQLGLYAKALEIAREWYEAMPPGKRIVPLYQLHSMNIKYGDRALGLSYGEELIRTDQGWRGRFMSRLWVASSYLEQYELKRARSLMEEGARYLDEASRKGRGNRGQFHLARGRSALARLQAKFALLQGKYEEAERLALAAVEHANEAIKRSRALDKRFQYGAYSQYVASVGVAAKAFKAQGKNFEGESEIAEAVEFLRQENWLAAYYPVLVRMAAAQRLSQHRFADALILAQRSGRAYGESTASLSSSALQSEQVRLAALIGLGRWDEARQGYRDLERRLKGQPALRRLVSGIQRGAVRLIAGEYEDASRFLGAAYNARRERLGAAHVLTAQAGGLYGIALWRMSERTADLSGAEEGKRRLAESAHVLMDSDGLQTTMSSAGLGQVYRRLILEAQLEALYPAMAAAQAAAINEGFGIADRLRSSSVQQAIVEAAVRAAANVPGLSDLIRQIQDADREMGSLYEYLVDESGETLSVSDPQATVRLKRRLETLENARLLLLRQVRQRFPDFDALTQPRTPDGISLAKQLQPTEALLSMLPTARQTYLWLVTSDGVSFAASETTEAQIETSVAALRKTLDVAGQASRPQVDADAAYQLYRNLVAPMRARAGSRGEWIMVAGGILGQVPFATLLTRPDRPADYVGAPWLVKEMALSSVPSAAAWMALRQLPPHKNDKAPLIAFGDPDFAGEARAGAAAQVRNLNVGRSGAFAVSDAGGNLPPIPMTGAVRRADLPALPETREEIMAIATALSADPGRDVFLGPRASRRNVIQLNGAGELAKRRVVMFATHGLMPGDLPNLRQPALALAYAQGGTGDWLLTLEDVLTLKLDADWVVLSACNTAAADGRSGEAVSGLGRGFFYAGARSVLVTHWAVETQSAKDITSGAFVAYANGRTSRAEALRSAQLALIAKPRTSHPALWAPFALIGDGGR